MAKRIALIVIAGFVVAAVASPVPADKNAKPAANASDEEDQVNEMDTITPEELEIEKRYYGQHPGQVKYLEDDPVAEQGSLNAVLSREISKLHDEANQEQEQEDGQKRVKRSTPTKDFEPTYEVRAKRSVEDGEDIPEEVLRERAAYADGGDVQMSHRYRRSVDDDTDTSAGSSVDEAYAQFDRRGASFNTSNGSIGYEQVTRSKRSINEFGDFESNARMKRETLTDSLLANEEEEPVASEESAKRVKRETLTDSLLANEEETTSPEAEEGSKRVKRETLTDSLLANEEEATSPEAEEGSKRVKRETLTDSLLANEEKASTPEATENDAKRVKRETAETNQEDLAPNEFLARQKREAVPLDVSVEPLVPNIQEIADSFARAKRSAPWEPQQNEPSQPKEEPSPETADNNNNGPIAEGEDVLTRKRRAIPKKATDDPEYDSDVNDRRPRGVADYTKQELYRKRRQASQPSDLADEMDLPVQSFVRTADGKCTKKTTKHASGGSHDDDETEEDEKESQSGTGKSEHKRVKRSIDENDAPPAPETTEAAPIEAKNTEERPAEAPQAAETANASAELTPAEPAVPAAEEQNASVEPENASTENASTENHSIENASANSPKETAELENAPTEPENASAENASTEAPKVNTEAENASSEPENASAEPTDKIENASQENASTEPENAPVENVPAENASAENASDENIENVSAKNNKTPVENASAEDASVDERDVSTEPLLQETTENEPKAEANIAEEQQNASTKVEDIQNASVEAENASAERGIASEEPKPASEEPKNASEEPKNASEEPKNALEEVKTANDKAAEEVNSVNSDKTEIRDEDVKQDEKKEEPKDKEGESKPAAQEAGQKPQTEEKKKDEGFSILYLMPSLPSLFRSGSAKPEPAPPKPPTSPPMDGETSILSRLLGIVSRPSPPTCPARVHSAEEESCVCPLGKKPESIDYDVMLSTDDDRNGGDGLEGLLGGGDSDEDSYETRLVVKPSSPEVNTTTKITHFNDGHSRGITKQTTTVLTPGRPRLALEQVPKPSKRQRHQEQQEQLDGLLNRLMFGTSGLFGGLTRRLMNGFY